MNAVDMQGVIEKQQTIICALQHELAWNDRLFSNPTLKPPDKLIIWKTTPREVKRGQAVEQAEEKKLYITKLADEVGMSPDTFGSRLQRIAETSGAMAYRREREPAQDGTPVLRVYVAPTPALATPEQIVLPPAGKTGAGHGGKRVKACTSCGSHNLVETRQVVCADCSTVQEEKRFYPVNAHEDTIPQDDASLTQEQKNATPQDDASLNQDFVVPATPQLDEVLLPVTTNILPQVSPSSVAIVEPESENERDGKMTDGNSVLETWLARRIGNVPHQFIFATGKMTAADKYFSLPKGYTPDISAYLRGELGHIYGSIPLNTNGTTQLLSFDCDTTERALRKNDILRMLANAGASPICWQRRPGRWHLEIYFDTPINAQAAYQWAIQACPLLAEFEECYPVKGIEDKRNQRLSWPLWYRDGDQVIECQASALFPSMDSPIYSAGVQSDLERLVVLVAQAVTPASLIPVLPIVAQELHKRNAPVVVLLEKPSLRTPVGMSDSDVAKAVIKAWNNEHTWEEISDVQSGRFLASWRGERTPSVVIDQDGEHACDYGNHGNWPKKVDKFEAWCLIEKRNKKAELAKLCAEYRAIALGEQIAS